MDGATMSDMMAKIQTASERLAHQPPVTYAINSATDDADVEFVSSDEADDALFTKAQLESMLRKMGDTAATMRYRFTKKGKPP